LGGLALLGAAFLFANFHAAVSSTQDEHTITTTRGGEGLPGAMQQREKITIVVDGEGALAGALKKAVPAALGEAGLGEVELAQAVEAGYPNPVLVIQTESRGQSTILSQNPPVLQSLPQRVFWTPFYASSRVTVRAGYASNGDATFLDRTSTVYIGEDGPVLNMSAELNISDRSWGLLSRRGYDDLLADYTAKQIVESVKNLYLE
jgi:hypothetical protein